MSLDLNLSTIFMYILGLVGLYLVLKTLLSSFVVVGGNEISLLERRWLGKDMSDGRVIAQSNQVGIQARVLGPGIHSLLPWLYITTKVPFTIIEKGQVGLVEAIDGDPVAPGHIFGGVVECNFFQDGEAFLLKGGQKGPQVQTLPPGFYRINTTLFKITIVEATRIEDDKIGVLAASDGAPIPTGRLLGDHIDGHNNFQNGQKFLQSGGQKGPQLEILTPGIYYINTRLFEVKRANAAVVGAGMVGLVDALDGAPLPDNEFVAKAISGHQDFQDGASFLKNGGQRGPQLDVLRPGIYRINPLMFNISSSPVTEVQRGQVAVIVSNIGQEPSAAVKARQVLQAGTDATPADPSKETYVVPKGYRGIQEEVSGPGRYYLNIRAFIPYIIDTTNQTIDWDEKESNGTFDPLKIVSKDGFSILMSVKVVIRVRPDQAPYMVAKVGSIENLVEHVVHPMIDSSFRNQASMTEAMAFMQNRKEEQGKAEEHVRAELDKYHVECVSVLICQIVLPQDLMDTQTRKIIAEQQLPQYTAQQQSEEGRISVEKTRATASAQQAVVNAEIAVDVAKQKKLETITLAEGSAQSVELQGKGEAAAISAKGLATAEALTAQQKAVGQTNLTVIKALEQLKDYGFPLMPSVMSIGQNAGGEGGLTGILTKLLASKQV